MKQPRSGRPARASRPARRSLAEFALPAGDAPVVKPAAAAQPAPPTPAAPTATTAPPTATTAQPAPAAPPHKPSIKKPGKGQKKSKQASSPQSPKVAAEGLRQASKPDRAMSEKDAKLHQVEALTSAAAKAAKDYQAWMLGQMKTNIGAALNFANGFAGASPRTDLAAHPDAREPGNNAESHSADQTPPAAAKVADDYRAKAFELMNANINTMLEFTRRLFSVKTPTEFSELSTSHARKQMELIVKQTTELGSIAQRLTASQVQRMTTGFAKPKGESKIGEGKVGEGKE